MKKIVPLIACEIPFYQCVCKLVFGVDIFELNFWVQIHSVNNQARATLWVLDTCLIVGLRLLMIILITASLSSKMYSIAPNIEKTLCSTAHGQVAQIKIVVLGWNLGLVLGVVV